jgi:hypothetical protein
MRAASFSARDHNLVPPGSGSFDEPALHVGAMIARAIGEHADRATANH